MQTSSQYKIPVVIGRNRLRGNAVGAMIDNDLGDNTLGRLREILAAQAKAGGIDDDIKAWVDNSVGTLLKMYEESFSQWQSDKQDTIGHVYEAAFPSGVSLLFGERRVLARI